MHGAEAAVEPRCGLPQPAGRRATFGTRLGPLLALFLGLVLTLWSAPSWAGGPEFELVKSESLVALPRGRSFVVAVKLKNIGTQTWDPAKKFRLAYHLWRPGEAEPFVFEGLRSELPEPVAPGQSVWVNGRIEVPDVEGRIEVQWAMVQESVAWSQGEARGARQSYLVETARPAWRAIDVRAPAQWSLGAAQEVQITLENEGPATWDPARGDRVALRWYRSDGTPLDLEGSRGEFSAPVAPGERAELSFVAQAPKSGTGPVLLRVEPVREGVRWYGASAQASSPSGLESAAVQAEVLLRAHPLQWSIQGVGPTMRMPADEVQHVPVQISNLGRETWDARDVLSYVWFDAAGIRVAEGMRTSLPPSIAPGQHAQVQARVRSPKVPGSYTLKWELVREGVRWFGAPLSGRRLSEVEVVQPRLAYELLEADSWVWGWTGGRRVLHVRLANRGSEAWSEAAGDRLAYHWRETGPVPQGKSKTKVVTYEGARTHFKQDVEPGAVLELDAHVVFPREPGTYVLEWEMVREHARWYGTQQKHPPTQARALRVRVVLQLALGLLTLGVALVLRVWRSKVSLFGARAETHVSSVLAVLPLIWLVAVVAALGVVFNELARIHLWKGGALAMVSGACLFALPALLFTGRRRWRAAVALAFAASTVAFFDIVYMHFFGSIVPLRAIGHAGHLWEVIDSAVTRVDAEQAWLFVPPLAGVAALLIYPTAKPDPEPDPEPDPAPDPEPVPKGRRWRGRLISVFAVLALSAPALSTLGGALQSALGSRVFSEQDNVGRMGVFNAHVFELGRTLRELFVRERLSDAQREQLRADFETQAQAQTPVSTAAGHGSGQGMNLLLIQVEALQQWVIGLEVEGQQVTPFLNRWHEQGLSFSNIIDQTAQGKTSDAEYLALNAQHPLSQGSTAFLRADNQFWTLAHVLKDAGYATFSAHPYRRGFWNRAVLHPRYGFDKSWFRRELGKGIETGWGLADGPFLERVSAKLTELPQPWFAFLITLSLHHPYTSFPSSLSELKLGKLEGTPVGNYLQAMNYFDRQLEATLSSLEAAGLRKHTVIALFGDHDARFELHRTPELLELLGLRERGWTPSMKASMERVPLFVHVPGGPTGQVDRVGGQIDIAPTLLSALGHARPVSFMGRALLGEAATPESQWVAYPGGGAYAEDRMFVPRGREIPAGGACFHFPSGKQRPREDCAQIEAWAQEQLARSHASLDANLARWISGQADR